MAETTKIILSAEDRTRAGIESAKAGLQSLAGTYGRVAGLLSGTLAGGGLLALVKQSIDAGDELNKLSQKVGVSVESLSALKYAGDLSGVGLEALATGIKKLSVNMNEVAAGGTSDAADAFKALGINVKDAAGNLKSADALLLEVAGQFEGIEDGAGKTAAAVALFGRSGADLIPLLNQGAGGIAKMREEAYLLGVVMGGNFARTAEAVNDNFSRLATVAKGAGLALADGVLGILKEVTDEMVAAAKETGGFARSFNPLTEAFRAIMVLGANVVFVFKGIGTEIGGIAAQIAALARGDFTGFSEIGRMMKEDAKKARQEFDEFEKRLMGAGQASAAAASAAAGPARRSFRFGDKTKTEKTAAEKFKRDPAIDEFFREEEKARLLVEDFIGGNRKAIERAGEDQRRIGLREREIQILEAVRKLEDDATEARRRAFRDIKDPELYARAVEDINSALEEQKRQMEATTGAVYDYATSWEAGAKKALASYLDEVDNLAAKSQTLFTQTFKGIEDALVDFVMTGKLSFKSLADSIIRELIRIQVQQNVTRQLANWLGQAGGFLGEIFGSGGGVDDLFGSIEPRASGGPVFPGRAYLVGERQPELFVPSVPGTIVPNPAMAGGPTYNMVNHFTVSGPVDRRSQDQIAAAVYAGMTRAARRNG